MNDLEQPEGELVAPQTMAMSAAAQSVKSEIESHFIIAQRFPRDEAACRAKLIESMKRPVMAFKAEYKLPLGGKDIIGPTIDFAREAARCWGHMESGIKPLENQGDASLIEAYAVDYQTGRRARKQARVKHLVQRKRGGDTTEWVEPDETELQRNVIDSALSRMVRNTILELIPPDAIEEAIMQSRQTIADYHGGKTNPDRNSMMVTLLGAFGQFGIKREGLETRLGHQLETSSDAELDDLRAIFAAIQTGKAGASEFFPSAAPKAQQAVDAAKAKVTADVAALVTAAAAPVVAAVKATAPPLEGEVVAPKPNPEAVTAPGSVEAQIAEAKAKAEAKKNQ